MFDSKSRNIQKLKQFQSLPLEAKIQMSKGRIKSFYDKMDGKAYEAFSGGRDSTVLLHLIRNTSGCEDIEIVFSNTGLEFPEIVEFVKKQGNVTIVRPKMTFVDVLTKYGFPIVSKKVAANIRTYNNTKDPEVKYRMLNGSEKGKNFKIPDKWQYLTEDRCGFKVTDRCCDALKKEPMKSFEKKTGKRPIMGTMAVESMYRTLSYNGHCNSFLPGNESSTPMIFWTEQDVTDYIKINNIEISTAYTEHGYKRTGCVFCGFGCHMEKGDDKRFVKLKQTHPKLYDYCMNKLGFRHVLQEYGIDIE